MKNAKKPDDLESIEAALSPAPTPESVAAAKGSLDALGAEMKRMRAAVKRAKADIAAASKLPPRKKQRGLRDDVTAKPVSRVRLRTPDDIVECADRLRQGLKDGTLNIANANAMVSLLNNMIKLNFDLPRKHAEKVLASRTGSRGKGVGGPPRGA